MSVTAEQITIAITVYNRRQYLKQSIGSALSQTVPVRVMVVEDCGPDPAMESYVRKEFGARVEYHRNRTRRGIFGNWNACIELCQTRWLSILHDDDYLMPEFVAAMIRLGQHAGERGLYWGQTIVIDDQERPLPQWQKPPLPGEWMPVTLQDILCNAPFSYPGQLFCARQALALGAFRDTSLYCGDWELWAKLVAFHGGAQTAKTVAVFRDHGGWDRGTNKVYRSGKTFGLAHIQRKRNLALFRRLGGHAHFNRDDELRRSCIPTRYLLQYACGFSPLYLSYNVGLLYRSKAPHLAYAVFREIARLIGPRFVKWSSAAWRRMKRMPRAHRG
jgi:glycosyltransferase involved in cell wall biosynthesis